MADNAPQGLNAHETAVRGAANTADGVEESTRLLERSVDAIICADANDRITIWNPAAERMFGYAKEEAAGMPVQELIPGRHREAHLKGFERFLQTERPVLIGKTVEVEAVRKDGLDLPVEISLFAEKMAGKWVFMSIIRDITLRKRAEEHMLRHSALLNEANSELSVLFEVSSAISHTIDLEALLSSMLDTITRLEIFKVERKGGIFLVEEDGTMTLRAHLGHRGEFIDAHKDMKVGDCLCGKAARTGEIVISGNSSNDARHTIRYPDMSPHGHIIVPLKAGSETIGVLYLYTPPGAMVGEGHKKLLYSIGNQLGVAITNSRLYERTKSLSLRDPLTGLANRRLMNIEVERNAARTKRYGVPFSAIMADIDHFKRYNDAHGHGDGDRLLEDVARLLLKATRQTDLVVRYGGEEFLILLPETALPMACVMAERIRAAVRESTGVTVSLGVASCALGLKEGSGLIDRADAALFEAKRKGRDRVEASP